MSDWRDLTDAFDILELEFSEAEGGDLDATVVEAFRAAVRGLAELWRFVSPNPDSVARANAIQPTGQPWNRKGVVLPEGTELRITYHPHGVEERGSVSDGKLVFGEPAFDYPSPAVSSAIRRAIGRHQSANGWMHIDARLSGKWRPFRDLRQD